MIQPRKKTVLFVGSFADDNANIAGGNLTVCRTLMASSFSRRLFVVKLDSTQISLPLPPLPIRLKLAVSRLVRFRRALREDRPDAALIFSSSGLSFLEKSVMAKMAAARRIPVLFSIRDGNFLDTCRSSRLFLGLARRMLAGVEKVICQGEKWQAFYSDKFGFPSSRCPILPNWTVTEEHLRIPVVREKVPPGSTRETVEILYLGWVERFKGVFELLETVRRIKAERPSLAIRLTMAGGGSALEEAKAWAGSQGLGDSVAFLGWVPASECLSLLGACDIFVLFSRTEGLPNSMVEAMGAGRPVVVTPVGSIPDVVQDGLNGLLVPVGDLDRMHQALQSLVLDPTLRMRLGEKARDSASRFFTPETAADRLIGLIDEISRDNP